MNADEIVKTLNNMVACSDQAKHFLQSTATIIEQQQKEIADLEQRMGVLKAGAKVNEVGLLAQIEDLRKDKEMLDKLLRPSNWLGVAEVNTVKGSATWYMSRDAINEFYATDKDAIRKANRDTAMQETKPKL